MAKKSELLDVLIEATKRHGRKSRDFEVMGLRGIIHLVWSQLTKKQRILVAAVALDPEGLDLAMHMKPKKVEFGGVTAQRF